MPFTDRDLIAHISKLPHARGTFKQLVRELASKDSSKEWIDQALDRLTATGELIETKNGHYVVTAQSREYAVGRLNVHRDGYAFLIPDTRSTQYTGDIYIPKSDAGRAMHGDRVIVHISRIEAGGKADGELVRILARAQRTVVGEFRKRARGAYVVPHDPRIQQWIQIPEGLEVPDAGKQPKGPEGPLWAAPPNPDRVGAMPVVVKTLDDLDGMIVNVEILEFPEDGGSGVGRVHEILGHPDDFGVDVEVVIRKHHIPHRFPEPVLAQARGIPSEIGATDLEGRRDFRSLDIVTIDGETARDFDDAVHVEKLENGNWALQVHIADVSHYVRPGSAIDHEAAFRGTSVYFPDRAVPMLPVELSTDICSLRPDVDRLVLSALLELDHKGDVVSQAFCRGVIRSAFRMTYTGVHRILEENEPHPLKARFEAMQELALILNRKRVKRGSIDFDLPEALIEFDEFGEMTGVKRSPRNVAHRLIEEFMLAANEAVASHIENAEIPSIYRIHEPPDGKRVMDFEEVAAKFGVSLGVGAIPVKRFPMMVRNRDGSKTRRALTIPDAEIAVTSRMYQKLVAKIAGKPEERILSYLMLRSLKQARYSERNVGHFALAAPSYTHFTSPIRRYPDLIVHRILKTMLDGVPPRLSEGELHAIATDTSDTERRAAEAERELVEWKKAKFMIDRVGDEFSGLIISTTRFGFFVELNDLFVEGLVPLDTLPGDRYMYNETTRKIVGQRSKRTFSMGDAVEVRLDRVDAVEKKLNFSIVEPRGGGRVRRGERRS